MIDKNDFWGSNYYNHPPLSEEVIELAESRLQVKLPGSYVDLLRVQNGGYTSGFVHPMSEPTRWSADHVPVFGLAGIVSDPDHKTTFNLLETEYMTNEWGLPERQVLLLGEGHW